MRSSRSPGAARRASMSSVHIVGVAAERLGRRVQHRIVGVVVAVAGHHGVAPLVEVVALLGVEAHELGDHDERHVDGELLHEVAARPCRATSSMIWFDSSRMWSVSARTLAGREAPVDEPPLAGVLGVVHRDDRHRRGDPGPHAVGRASTAPGSARCATTSAWRRDHPQLVLGVPVDGGVLPEPAVGLPRVVVEARVEGRRSHRAAAAASCAGSSIKRLFGSRRRRARDIAQHERMPRFIAIARLVFRSRDETTPGRARHVCNPRCCPPVAPAPRTRVLALLAVLLLARDRRRVPAPARSSPSSIAPTRCAAATASGQLTGARHAHAEGRGVGAAHGQATARCRTPPCPPASAAWRGSRSARTSGTRRRRRHGSWLQVHNMFVQSSARTGPTCSNPRFTHMGVGVAMERGRARLGRRGVRPALTARGLRTRRGCVSDSARWPVVVPTSSSSSRTRSGSGPGCRRPCGCRGGSA